MDSVTKVFLPVTEENQKMKTISIIPFFFAFSLCAQEETVPGGIAERVKSPFEEIQLFPNPTSEIIFIKNGELIDSYQVIDMQGRVVQSGIHNAQIISLIDVPIGYYFVEMKIGEERQRIKVQKY